MTSGQRPIVYQCCSFQRDIRLGGRLRNCLCLMSSLKQFIRTLKDTITKALPHLTTVRSSQPHLQYESAEDPLIVLADHIGSCSELIVLFPQLLFRFQHVDSANMEPIQSRRLGLQRYKAHCTFFILRTSKTAISCLSLSSKKHIIKYEHLNHKFRHSTSNKNFNNRHFNNYFIIIFQKNNCSINYLNI